MPHQQAIYDTAFELDPATGYLAYSRVVVVGPRQGTGKTALIFPVMTHRCVGFDDALVRWVRQHLGRDVLPPGPQRALYTAQTADKARERWRDTHVKRLEASGFAGQFTPRFRTNMEAMLWRNGSMWAPESTTEGTGGTGDTVDLGVIDEAWSRRDNSTELGMRPAQLTRHWSQIWITSMVPGPSRREPGGWPYLKQQIDLGIARVAADLRYGTAFFFFGADPDADPADPQTWYRAMPGLGLTVPEGRVREDFEAHREAGTMADFKAEYLSIVPETALPRWGLVRESTWRDCRDPNSVIAGVKALGVEFTEDRGRAVVGAAGRRADGDWHVEVIEPGPAPLARVPVGTRGVTWVLPRLLELVEDHEICAVVLDPRRPAFSLKQDLEAAGVRVLTPNQSEVAAACGRFYDATGEQPRDDWDGLKLRHLDQPELNDAMRLAQPHYLPGGSFVLVRRGGEGELSDLYSVVLAMHGVDVAGGENYDLADSVDASFPCVCGRYVYPADVDGQWRHAVDDSSACEGFVPPWGAS